MLKMFLDALLFKDGVLMGVSFWLLSACIAGLVLIMGAFIVYCCKELYIWINTKEIIEEDVIATVIEKEYEPGYTSMISGGKCCVPISHSASYDVYLKYGNEEFIIDDEELYNQVKENDRVPAKLIMYISKNGKVLDTDLEIDS